MTGLAQMISPLETAVRQWRELGLLPNRHSGERETGNNTGNNITTENKNKKRRKKTDKDWEYNNNNGKKLQQTTLFGVNQEKADVEAFGDKLSPKPDNTFRVVSQNIQTLPVDARSERSRKVVNTIGSTESDVFLMGEVKLYWPLVENQNKWFERVIGKFRAHRSLFGCNTTEHSITGLQQYGGVGLIATDEAVNRARNGGKDPSGLGRWVWMRFQGRNGHMTRVVSIYRPCHGNNGAASVHAQHVRYFKGIKELDRKPREALYEDLFEEATIWQTEGDHIIIAGDVNEDVRTGLTNEFFTALGLREVILERHSQKSPPATNDNNDSREPIDGIWASKELEVTAAGYLPFGDGCDSDHRLVWADFSYHTVFGQELPSEYRPPSKKLRANDPRLVKRYNRKVKSKLKGAGLIQRAFTLQRKAENYWNSEMEAEYNQIQTASVAIRSDVEKTLRRLKMGGVRWSPRLQKFRDMIELWKMMSKKRRGRRISPKRIRRWMKKVDRMNAFDLSRTEVNIELKNALQAYKLAKTKADNWRNEFLDSLAEALSKEKGTSPEAEEKTLKQIERQRRQARNVKRVRGKGQQSSVNMVYENDEEGRHERTTKDAIEDACIRENSSRFFQSSTTPFMISPLVDDFGYLADTPAAEQVLNGTYQPPDGTDYYAKLLLDQLYIPWEVTKMVPISVSITTEEHKKSWRKQNERTSSEPTGLSFNHYKAAAHDPMLADFDATMRNLPYAKGFAPQLWKNITDVEILKKAEVYDINLMRTIQLMNSELNMNNKKLGRDLMTRGEKCKLIAREQYGSRKKHQSITAALNKRLTMDLLRQRRQSGALCSNDAKSCYDRVVHSVASLSMRRLGAPIEPINSMFISLQKAAHRIRTAFGVSEKKYGDDRDIPLQGLGQGNGCGPAGWAIVSTPIINLMRAAGFGATFLTAISVSLVAFVCYAFVDDTDVVHTAQDVNTTGEEIMRQMQTVIDHWEGGLRATGGAIVPKKSYWYLIDWIWERGKWRYATQEDIPGNLTIRDTCGTQRVILKRYDPDIAKETLGVFLAMNGNNKEEIIKLRNKTEEFAEQLRTGMISKWDAWYAITATIMKTLEYPMLATTITEDEWDFIMRPIRQSGLPKIQLASNFPRKVLYGPKKFQGMGIMHPFYTQELSHLALCLHEGESDTITGELLRASMEQLQLELGTPGHLMQLDFSTLGKLATDCWIKTVWEFAWKHEIEIIDTGPSLELYRWNDQFLMEEFARQGWKGHELKKLNECRMYLEVTTLAEITSVDGKNIKEMSWTGKKDKNKCNQYQWPRSPPSLPARHWQIWRKALRECFIHPMKTDARELQMPLGDWEKDVTATWQWFYSDEDDSLYKREGLLWYEFRPQQRRRRRQPDRQYEIVLSTQREVPTELLCFADAQDNDGLAILTSTSQSSIPERSALLNQDLSSLTLESLRQEQNKKDKWAIAEWDCKHTIATRVAEDIKNGTATAVSDGSFKNENGTSAFLVCAEDDSQRIIGVNAVPGACKEQSAYRSELAGISGILMVLDILCKKFQITSGAIEIGLDGQQALIAASEEWPLNIAQPDFDLLKDIRAKAKKLPLKIKWHWIKGHQDDSIDYQHLDSWAKNNVQADTMAKLYWNHCEKHGKRLPNQEFGDEGWTYRYNTSKRSRFTKKDIYEELFGDTTRDHWINKQQITVDQIHSIDWDNCERAIKRLPFSRQLWLSKHASGHCAVGRMMKMRKHWEHSMCPRCLQDNETTEHVLLCQDPRATEHFERLSTKLDQDLVTMETAPELRRTIIRKITNWRRRRRVTAQVTNKYGEREASEHQDQIGWTNFMLGRMAPEWAAAQQYYYDWLGRRKTGRRWLVAITVKLLNLSWDMWDHRNKILHSSVHPWKLVTVRRADTKIDEEYEQGYTNLMQSDYKWLKQPLRTVKKLSIEHKLQWIESVRLARIRFDRYSVAQFQSFRPERIAIAKWIVKGPPKDTVS